VSKQEQNNSEKNQHTHTPTIVRAMNSPSLVALIVLLLVLSIVLVQCDNNNNNLVKIWPKPYQTVVSGQVTAVIINHEAFTFDQGNVPPGEAQRLLQDSLDRYKNLIFYNKDLPHRSSSPLCQRSDFVCLNGVQFNFDGNASNVNLDLNMDEKYSMSVDSGNKVLIRASSIWGAMRALESFSQLVIVEKQSADGNSEYYTLTLQSPFTINDRPRFPWRGLMIDSSRHFLPVRKILRIIQAISYFKFNVLHWHIVDAQSFPFDVPGAPNLIKAAYSPKSVYSMNDIQKIVQTARSYGVRVVAEFDMPGHAASWGVGYPEITAKCPSYASNINNIPLDPTNEKTFQIIEQVISAAVKVFPDQFMHFGADELVQSCWKEDPNISQWMQKKGWSDYNKLLAYFEDRLQKIYQKYQKTMIAWEELLLEHANVYQLPPDSIVQAWRSKKALGDIIGAGYRGLLSKGWYLDVQVPGNITHYLWGDTWQDFYKNDPTSGMGFSPEQESRVLGGEACMWGEQVDAVNIESRVFPRVLGAAERLWSQAEDTQDIEEAEERLIFSRCHVLVRRGFHAGAIRPDYCDAVEIFY
jgi:hexosaminidase